LIARQLYGAPDENQYSVLAAVQRNPSAFERRMLALPAVFVFIIGYVYGPAFAMLQLAFALLGLTMLVARRQILIATLLVLWPSYLLAYIPFFARYGYLLSPYFCLNVLVAVGIVGVVRWVPRVLNNLRARRGFEAAGPRPLARLGTATALAFVGIGLITHGPFAVPQMPVLGQSGEEQASLFMSRHVERSTLVAAFMPAVPWTAKMTWQPLVWDLNEGAGPTTSRFGTLTVHNAAELDQWIARTGVKAFYLDYLLKHYQPQMYAAVESELGHGLDVVFQTHDDDPAKASDLVAQGYAYDGSYRVVALSADRQ
jgi:hypothetical protein